MKKLAMLLGCGMVAFAIGCGDGGSTGGSGTVTPAPMMPDSKMKEMMDKNAPAGADAAAGGEKKEGDAAAEKKEGDAPAEKKEGDAPAEKKEGDTPAEKKE